VTTLLASGIIVLALDQHSKSLVRLHLANRFLSCGSVLRLRCVRHVERIYQRDSVRALLVLLWSAAFIAAILLQRSGDWFQTPAAPIGLGFALGGAAGNLVDILRLRCVIDFIDVRWWPIFNLADVAIVAGLTLAFVA
jgi:signal peptidase II